METKRPIEAVEKFITNNKEKLLKVAPSHLKLLIDPEGYAKGAVEELERQLQGTKSIKRRSKLIGKINEWKQTLVVLEATNNETSQEKHTEESTAI